jgi:phosphoribosyl 1,2-cyclic phosphodiesterase
MGQICEVAKGVDLFIVDAQYTEPELIHKRGWGHGSFSSALAMARLARAKKVAFTHHDPTRTDDQIDRIVGKLRAGARQNDPPILMSREGLEIELG